MDTLYIGDIPQDFCYADFNTYYIDLYNTNTFLPNRTYQFYRVYMYDNAFYYEPLEYETSNYNYNRQVTLVDVTDNYMYRRDIDVIFVMTFCFVVLGLWLFNLISSIIRKGGALGGLL